MSVLKTLKKIASIYCYGNVKWGFGKVIEEKLAQDGSVTTTSAVQCITEQNGAVQCSRVQCSAVQCSAAQCSVTECSAACDVGGNRQGLSVDSSGCR